MLLLRQRLLHEFTPRNLTQPAAAVRDGLLVLLQQLSLDETLFPTSLIFKSTVDGSILKIGHSHSQWCAQAEGVLDFLTIDLVAFSLDPKKEDVRYHVPIEQLERVVVCRVLQPLIIRDIRPMALVTATSRSYLHSTYATPAWIAEAIDIIHRVIGPILRPPLLFSKGRMTEDNSKLDYAA